ncbi:hypothetical protein KMW28_16235 [Flammeovirga yaeyamensis]|uniref:Anti-sigma factor n=1 Tax=Flammeovirga yaeyamensis TaxID=367791 RepID=A0AAX1N0X4_9BACT|nr:hypothetical protein [Flammeovirga yaeyamensis]MBB3698440.1 antitoxin component of MazEF toxin-antitoxin module [Flammeovirga yaeyamensis]NMF34210.1 hypothetical protein [Flammeovirga yaeyamensis]QWG01195.1 hypothetical protein KMW28_16235 [Flammeovirga yaeyamensis]
MENQELTTLFDAYIENQLSSEEVESFDLKLKEDAQFKKDFQAHQLLINHIENGSIKKELNDFENRFIPDKTTLIDDYLNNSLSEELKLYVENKLENDEEFKLEIEAQQLLIEQVKRKVLKERLKTFESSNTEDEKTEAKEVVFKVEHPQEENQKKQFIYTRVAAIAASVLIVLFAGIYYLNSNSFPSSQITSIAKYSIDIEQKNKGMGFAQSDLEKVQVKIYKSEMLKGQYKFDDDVLSIYVGKAPKSQVELLFDATSDPPFLLTIDQEKYYVDFTESLKKLK